MFEDFVASAGWLKTHAQLDRQGRRRRFLLRRRHLRTSSRCGCRISARRRRSTAARPSAEDVPKIKAPLLLHYAANDQRRQRGLAGVRRGAQGEQQDLHGATSTRTRSTASTTTRRRATTRRRPSSRGSGRWTSSTSTCDEWVALAAARACLVLGAPFSVLFSSLNRRRRRRIGSRPRRTRSRTATTGPRRSRCCGSRRATSSTSTRC